MRVAIATLLICSLLLSTGCATMLSGKTERVYITSTPSGADIIVAGQKQGTTPGYVRLRKGNRYSDHRITLTKEGYTSKTIEVRHSSNSLRWLNLIPIGAAAAGTAIAANATATGYKSSSHFDSSTAHYDHNSSIDSNVTLVIMGGTFVTGILGWTLFSYDNRNSGRTYQNKVSVDMGQPIGERERGQLQRIKDAVSEAYYKAKPAGSQQTLIAVDVAISNATQRNQILGALEEVILSDGHEIVARDRMDDFRAEIGIARTLDGITEFNRSQILRLGTFVQARVFISATIETTGSLNSVRLKIYDIGRGTLIGSAAASF